MKPAPYKECLSLKNKLHRLWWNLCASILFRPFGGPLFKKWRLIVLRIFGAEIGKGCAVHAKARIWAPWHLKMGDFTAIGPDAKIYNPGRIVIGSKCVVSQGAFLCTASHDITDESHRLITAEIRIDDFAWVAADAFVGMGVTVGQGAVVGARAAVFRDVDPWTVAGGNPAKFIKKRALKSNV